MESNTQPVSNDTPATHINLQALVAANSRAVILPEFRRLVNNYYACPQIFLGNLSVEQALFLRVYKTAFSKLSARQKDKSLEFYRKFLLLAGSEEYQAHQRQEEELEDARYRDLVTLMFKNVADADGHMETGTRAHINAFGVTCMHGFYGSGSNSDEFILQRVDLDDIKGAFRRLRKRKKSRVICGHHPHPFAYASSPDGTISDLYDATRPTIRLAPDWRYLISPGALDDGYYLVLARETGSAVRATFKRYW